MRYQQVYAASSFTSVPPDPNLPDYYLLFPERTVQSNLWLERSEYAGQSVHNRQGP